LAMGTLRGVNEPLFLRPKAYALLSHLARNMGRVVPKAELMDVVWPGVYVTEDSLTQSVREIRKVLGEEMVRTVSKRGYMLAGEAEPPPEMSSQPIVAVVRFRNESGNPADEAMVDGFAEDLINGVARFGTVTVLARNSSFSFSSFGRGEWPQIRARIGADYLVEGSLRRQGEHVVVAVSLVDIATASQLWGDRYQSQGAGLFATGGEIVEQIVSRLVTR
ncbi:MAG: adenylate cyclase, partial [Mesorhizobium sp.]